MFDANDPLHCDWIKSFEVTVSRPLLFEPFYLNVYFTADYPHPDATITIVSSDTKTFDKHDLRHAHRHRIASNNVSGKTGVPLKESDLNRFWSVRLTFVDNDGVERCFDRDILFGQIDVLNPTHDRETLFPERVHPAYEHRKDTGVCFSGGGTRAHLLAAGQMRFLQKYGHDKKIGYYSSVSGGSWASSIYTFASKANIEGLLGQWVEPENAKKRLKQKTIPTINRGASSGVFFASLLFNLVLTIRQQFAEHPEAASDVDATFLERFSVAVDEFMRVPPDRLWIEAVNLAFLVPNLPLSLTDRVIESSFTLDNASHEAIKQNSGQLQSQILNMLQANYSPHEDYPPYYIANSLMLRPQTGRADHYIPYEYTPLYQGAGFQGDWSTGTFKSMKIGGHSPMFSYDTTLISEVSKNKAWVMRQQFDSHASLATATGTSSSAFAGATSVLSQPSLIPVEKVLNSLLDADGNSLNLNGYESLYDLIKDTGLLDASDPSQAAVLKVFAEDNDPLTQLITSAIKYLGIDGLVRKMTPNANYFSPIRAESKVKNTQVNFGDAGLSDNFGLMALLRRGVKKIIVFVNTGTELELLDKPLDSGVTSTIDQGMAAFFGKADQPMDVSGVRFDGMEVFDGAKFANLEKQLLDCKARKEPQVARTKLRVKTNKRWDVPESPQVDILWYYNCRPESWEEAVGKQVIKALDKEGTKHIGKFPFYETFKVTILGTQAFESNLMTDIAQWNLETTKDNVEDLLS